MADVGWSGDKGLFLRSSGIQTGLEKNECGKFSTLCAGLLKKRCTEWNCMAPNVHKDREQASSCAILKYNNIIMETEQSSVSQAVAIIYRSSCCVVSRLERGTSNYCQHCTAYHTKSSYSRASISLSGKSDKAGPLILSLFCLQVREEKML